MQALTDQHMTLSVNYEVQLLWVFISRKNKRQQSIFVPWRYKTNIRRRDDFGLCHRLGMCELSLILTDRNECLAPWPSCKTPSTHYIMLHYRAVWFLIYLDRVPHSAIFLCVTRSWHYPHILLMISYATARISKLQWAPVKSVINLDAVHSLTVSLFLALMRPNGPSVTQYLLTSPTRSCIISFLWQLVSSIPATVTAVILISRMLNSRLTFQFSLFFCWFYSEVL